MNQTAQKLGMTQTSYVNPNGLPADGQVFGARPGDPRPRGDPRSSEYEYFYHIPRSASAAESPKFQPSDRTLSRADGSRRLHLRSGYNLVGSATRNGKRLIAVVLGSTSGMRARCAPPTARRGFANNGLQVAPSLGTSTNRCRSTSPPICATRCAAKAQSAPPATRTMIPV